MTTSVAQKEYGRIESLFRHDDTCLTCEALSTTQEVYAFTVFEQAFKDFGLPRALRTDNGVPFSSPN